MPDIHPTVTLTYMDHLINYYNKATKTKRNISHFHIAVLHFYRQATCENDKKNTGRRPLEENTSLAGHSMLIAVNIRTGEVPCVQHESTTT